MLHARAHTASCGQSAGQLEPAPSHADHLPHVRLLRLLGHHDHPTMPKRGCMATARLMSFNLQRRLD
jgi:hypothetical protein